MKNIIKTIIEYLQQNEMITYIIYVGFDWLYTQLQFFRSHIFTMYNVIRMCYYRVKLSMILY